MVATVEEVQRGKPVTIGRPIPNYTAYIVDESLNLLGPGRKANSSLAAPAWRRAISPGRTSPTRSSSRTRSARAQLIPILYRSGDAVSLNAEGNIAFHGRIDDQVKIRGFRVELGEIESALVDCDDVLQAAVVVRNDGGMERLVAFCVPEPKAIIAATTLREELKRRLPPYMIPERFETVPELPRLISGKTDRKALKAMPLSEAIVAANDEEPPRTDTEAMLLAAAKRVLPGRAITFEADFFLDLGGHSLIAAQFISIVRENPSFTGITLQDIYQHRTLRKIGTELDAKFGHLKGPPPDLSFAPPPLSRRIACTIAQASRCR